MDKPFINTWCADRKGRTDRCLRTLVIFCMTGHGKTPRSFFAP
jgi:hypothetical protein